MPISKVKIDTVSHDIISENGVHFITTTGTAAVTTKPYCGSIWMGTSDYIDSLFTGLTVVLKVPVAGNGSYGTFLNVNELGNHPVARNVNTHISTSYAVGALVILVYDAEQTMNAYYNSNSASTFTGVWKVADYDTTNIYQLKSNYGRTLGPSTGDSTEDKSLYRYQLLMEDKNGYLIPFGFQNNKATTYTKALTTAPFNPFSPIFYYVTTTVINVGGTISAYLYTQYLVDMRYSFNIQSNGTAGTTALTANKPVYIKMLYDKTSGTATFVQDLDSSNYLERSSIVQELPTTNPNISLSANNEYIFIQLGNAYDLYRVDMLSLNKNIWHWNNLQNICTIFTPETAEVNVQPDWNQTDTTAADFIKNKPDLSDIIAQGLGTGETGASSTRFIELDEVYYNKYSYTDMVVTSSLNPTIAKVESTSIRLKYKGEYLTNTMLQQLAMEDAERNTFLLLKVIHCSNDTYNTRMNTTIFMSNKSIHDYYIPSDNTPYTNNVVQICFFPVAATQFTRDSNLTISYINYYENNSMNNGPCVIPDECVLIFMCKMNNTDMPYLHLYKYHLMGVPYAKHSNTAHSAFYANLLNGHSGDYYLDYNNLSNKPTIPTVVDNITIDLTETDLANFTLPLEGGTQSLSFGDLVFSYEEYVEGISDQGYYDGTNVVSMTCSDVEDNGGGLFILLFDDGGLCVRQGLDVIFDDTHEQSGPCSNLLSDPGYYIIVYVNLYTYQLWDSERAEELGYLNTYFGEDCTEEEAEECITYDYKIKITYDSEEQVWNFQQLE